MRDRFICWLAWKLPRRLVYWATVRLMAHATGIYNTMETGKISILDALRTWE